MEAFILFFVAIIIALVIWRVVRIRSIEAEEAIRQHHQEINQAAERKAEQKSIKEAAATNEWLRKHNSLHRGPEDGFRESLATRSAREYREKSAREAEIAAAELAEMERLAEAERLELDNWRAMSKDEQVEVWLANRSIPSPQALGVSHRGAEHLAALWLTYLGEEQVVVTQEVGDGGVDVISTNFCCQVKNYKKQPVTSSEVRDLYGTAHSMSLKPLLMTSSYLSSEALEWATLNGVAAINYSAEAGTLMGLNELGESLLASGRYSA